MKINKLIKPINEGYVVKSKKKSLSEKYYICPECHNRTLGEVSENDDLYICDECGAEGRGYETFEGNIAFYDDVDESKKLKEGITNTEPAVKFQGKSSYTLTKDKKWEVNFDEAGNILARTRHGKPSYFKGHINDKTNDFPSTDEDNIILAAREQHGLKFGKKTEAFEKDGGPFWYFTKHGVGPGMLPRGVLIMDTVEDDNYGTYVALDKVLTTQELQDYELKEKRPPMGENAHHIKLSPDSKMVQIDVDDNSEIGDDSHPIQRGLGGHSLSKFGGSIKGSRKSVDEATALTTIKTSRIPRNATKLKGINRHNGEPQTFVKNKNGWTYDHNGVYVHPDTIRYGYTDVEVLDTDPNYKPKRTRAEYVVQGNYGYGWEDLTSSDDPAEAKNDLKAYRENETGVPHRLITRRVPIQESIDNDLVKEYDNYCKDLGIDKGKKSSKDRFLKDYAKHLTNTSGISGMEDKLNQARTALNSSPIEEAFKPSNSGIQSVKCYNRYNYTIQELRIDNDNKTFERGQFTMGKPDKKTKNRQEFEDIVDSLVELGYTEIKSDYRTMRNKTRNGVPTNEDYVGRKAAFNTRNDDWSDSEGIIDYDGEEAEITGCSVDNGKFRDSYWDVKFDDGKEFSAVSGYNLSPYDKMSESLSNKESTVENFLNKYGFTEERYPHITNSHNNVQWDIVNVSFVDGISAKDFNILKKNASECGASGIYLANVHKDSTDSNELWASIEFEFANEKSLKETYWIDNKEVMNEVDRLCNELEKAGWNYREDKYTGSKYYVIFMKRENNKAVFKAVKYNHDHKPEVIDITAEQVMGEEPMDSFDGLRRGLGKMLLPKRESKSTNRLNGTNGFQVNESKQSGEDKDFIKRIKAEVEKVIPYPEDFKVFYDGGPYSNRDYVLKMTRSDKSQTTSKIKGAIRDAGGTSIIGGIKKALARDYFDIAFDKKDIKTNGSLAEGYQPADEWWLKVNPDDIEGANELKGLYADDMIRNKNSLEQYGLSDRLTAELRTVFARYGSPVEYPEDEPVQHATDKKIEDYREELQAYIDKETGRPHKFFVDATFDGRLCIDINWGDWKHEHLFADRLVREFFESKGMGIRVEIETTEENGGDAYSATHYYSINGSHISDRVTEESAVDASIVESNEGTGECWAVFATDKSTGKEYCAGAYRSKAYAERAAAWDRDGDIEYGYGDFVYRVEQVTEYADELWKSSLELDKIKLANSKRTNEGFGYDDDIDSFDYDGTASTQRYEFVKSKSVIDMDGFNTDYTMYHDLENDTYVFVFGDSDIYGPDDGDFDWECDSLAEAEEWFDSYTGFEDDLDLMGESYDLSDEEKKLLIMGQDMGSWYDEILDNEEILNRYYDAENKAKRIASASNLKLSDFIDSLSEDVNAQNKDDTKSPIVHKKGDGSYLVQASSGDGYTAFNSSNVCMGHISAENDTVAKSKFDANKFDESLKEGLSGSGWWSVQWDLTLEGEEIRFDDLSETTQEHIADSILDGYLQGEIAEWDDDAETETYGWWVARFDISVEDNDRVRFDDLSETSQEHIANAIKDGYVSGEIFE